MTENEIKKIAEQFAIEGTVGELKAYGSGHIHETYRLKNADTQKPDYILQKINNSIFTNVEELMNNIQTVINHLQEQKQNDTTGSVKGEVLQLVPALDGKTYYQHTDGSFWRVYVFLEGTRSYDLIENDKQAREGGKGYGRFISALADLDPNKIFEVLPDFHNMQHRLNQLDTAIAKDPVDRLRTVAEEVNFVKERAERMTTIKRMGDAGELPLRITHNDTKFNNVLLNENDEAHCVIDLDTIMPGYIAYDFGDAVRTTINTADEDEKDLEKIQLNMNVFKAFSEGFIGETGATLTDNEVKSLSEGCLMLPFIMGVRFLSDYIDGDNYYRIHSPHHNLQRARAQFQLVRKLEENFEEIKNIIEQTSAKAKSK